MRQLLLLRHESPPGTIGACPTTPDRSMRAPPSAWPWPMPCATSGLAPDIVFVSSARRTLQTLEALTPSRMAR